jgi:two-component system CheB/CheR fusion protein
MAREGLDLELTAALYIAENEGQPVTRKGVQVNFNSKHRVINLTVKPIDSNVLPGDQTLIIFEPVEGGDEWPHDRNATEELGSEEIYELHNELRQSQEALQTVTEALQIKRKELTSSLKEVRAVSEEVQTTNEELRTSKEELESMNEELNTLNNQLTDQNYELSRANNTLHNFLQSTEIGMIFLDESLNIREFTAAVTDIFKLREVDKGRPLAEIVHKLEYDALIDEAESVLNTLTTIEKEVHTTTGQWYKLHIRPYRTTTGNIDGLVLTFSDITQQKQAQRAAKQQAHYISQIFNLVDHSIIELDREMRVLSADPSFYDSFGLSEEDTIGKMLFELGDGDWDIPDLRRLLDEIIPDLKEVRHHPVEHEFRNRGPCKLQFNALLVPDLDRVLLIISDLTKT